MPGPQDNTTPLQAAKDQAAKVNLDWVAKDPPLADFVGADLAKNITTLAGEDGAKALVRSFQAAHHFDEVARQKEMLNFETAVVNTAKNAKPEDQKALIDAAAALDKSVRSYDMMSPTAEQAMKQSLQSHDKMLSLPASSPERHEASQNSVQAMRAFFNRTENILQELYQKRIYDGPPKVDPSLPNKKPATPDKQQQP